MEIGTGQRLGWIATCLALIATPVCQGHREIEIQVAELTDKISREPKNADLYFRRAELYRYHQEWRRALADYDFALKLDPQLDHARLSRAATMLESGEPAAARPALDAYLVDHPNNPTALLIRARALVALKEYDAAVTDYAASIAGQPEPQPDYYVEQARALAAAGPARVDEAVRCLDAGIAKLGSVPALEMLAIDLELARKNYDAVLARLDRITAAAPRKESWLVRRAAVLEQAGRLADARAAYAQALAAVETLPPHRRHVAVTSELEATIRAALKRLGEGTPNVRQ